MNQEHAQAVFPDLPVARGKGQLECSASASSQRLLIAGVAAACTMTGGLHMNHPDDNQAAFAGPTLHNSCVATHPLPKILMNLSSCRVL